MSENVQKIRETLCEQGIVRERASVQALVDAIDGVTKANINQAIKAGELTEDGHGSINCAEFATWLANATAKSKANATAKSKGNATAKSLANATAKSKGKGKKEGGKSDKSKGAGKSDKS